MSVARFLAALSQGQQNAFEELDSLLAPVAEPQPAGAADDARAPWSEMADHADFAHADPVYCVAVHPRGDLVATGGGDDRGFVWNFRTGTKTCLTGHTDSVADIAFSLDGRYLASAGLEGAVRVWSVNTDASSSSSSSSAAASSSASASPVEHVKFMHALEGPEDGVEWIRWHPSGTVLVGGSQDGTCWMWNAVRGRCMQVFSGHNGYVTCGSFSNNGKKLVTGSVDRSLRIWNPQNGSSVKISGRTFHTGPINCLECVAASPLVLSGGDDGLVGITSLASSKIVSMLGAKKAPIEAIAAQTSQQLAAAGSNTGQMFIWDLSRGQLRSEFAGHSKAVTRILAHPTEPTIISAGMDGLVKVWDCRTGGNCVRSFASPQDGVLDMATDGKIIAVGSEDASTTIYAL